jgi:hypothetical protein
VAKRLLEEPDPAVLRLLDGTGLDTKIGVTIQLITVDPSGRPRIALLSVGEAVAVSPTHWRFALHDDSSSAHNLAARGRQATATVVLDGASHGHELRVVDVTPRAIGGRSCLLLDTTVTTSWRDDVDYATLTHGITYELRVPVQEVLARWAPTVTELARTPQRPPEKEQQ